MGTICISTFIHSSLFMTRKSRILTNRFPLIIIVDVSYSMTTEIDRNRQAIDKLNDALSQCMSSIRNSPIANCVAEICLISFSDKVEIIQDFALCREILNTPRFSATGRTSKFFDVFDVAIDSLTLYYEKRIGSCLFKKPAIIFITDGQPTDDDGNNINDTSILDALCDRVRNKVKNFEISYTKKSETKHKKIDVSTYAFHIGNSGTDSVSTANVLTRLVGEHNYKILEGFKFDEIFEWIVIVSESLAQGNEPNIASIESIMIN
jgi:uncharacterized protein YegL